MHPLSKGGEVYREAVSCLLFGCISLIVLYSKRIETVTDPILYLPLLLFFIFALWRKIFVDGKLMRWIVSIHYSLLYCIYTFIMLAVVCYS